MADPSSAQDSAASRPRGRPVLFELARLAVVVALPLIFVIAFLLLDAAQRDLEHATDDARRFAEQTAARSERFLADFRATLEAIARRPLVRAMDAEHCDPALSTLRELNPRAGNIIVADAEGWILCAATPPPGGQRIRIIDLDLHQAVMRDGTFQLSRPLIGRISKVWTVTAVQPVRLADETVGGAVGMAIDLRQLQPFGSLDGDRDDVVAGVVARPGIMIAHSIAPEQWIGKTVSDTPAIATMLERGEGTLRAAGFDGRDRLWAFRPVAGTDWIAYGSVAADVALAPGRQRALWATILIAVIVVATIVLAAYTAQRIARPIGAIASVARTRASGDVDARATPGGPKEVAEVADAFNAMADARSRTEHEREVAQTKLQLQLTRLDLLRRIIRSIGERQDLGSIFQVVIRRLEDDLPVDFACICSYQQAERVLIVTSVGVRSHALAKELALTEHARIAVDQNGLAKCVHGQLVYERDIGGTELEFLQRLARAGLRAMVIAPLAAQDSMFGVLIVARKQADSFSSNDCEFLRQLGDNVALATHQAQLYINLQNAYDDLRQSQQSVMQQERLRALGQMASGVAHDINNAIAPISLYTESLLAHESELSERARVYLTIIRRAIADVGETVSRMRDFYRPPDQQSAPTRVALNAIVGQVVDLTRVRWRDLPQQSGVTIAMQTELQQPLPPILGQESEIRDALTNLIFNAVDAMPEGGPLMVRTRASGDTVQLEVRDSGVGMDEETRQHCLEPFFTTKGERGTGLGLAMVYGMAQRHNAELEIDSALGRGTTVRISFPVAALPTEAAATSTALEAPSKPLSILIIDDDPLVLESLRVALENDGHRVTAADGGQVGIDAFMSAQAGSERFDVVITDLGMPHVDGRRVAEAVKVASPSTPVVLLTGWGQRILDEGEMPAHVDRVLNKPPKLRDLRAALAGVAS
jgi:signal transduction histidine kinase/ActR/RegA family two-component response regulator